MKNYKIKDENSLINISVGKIRALERKFQDIYEIRQDLMTLFPEAFEEESFPPGTRFKGDDNDVYLLCQISANIGKFIMVEGFDVGNRYSDEELKMKNGKFILSEKYKHFVVI